jgi:hypothetical protein
VSRVHAKNFQIQHKKALLILTRSAFLEKIQYCYFETRRLFKTTETELKDIAAAAMAGVRKPIMARGIAMIL